MVFYTGVTLCRCMTGFTNLSIVQCNSCLTCFLLNVVLYAGDCELQYSGHTLECRQQASLTTVAIYHLDDAHSHGRDRA